MYDQRIAEPTPAPESGDPWQPDAIAFPDDAPTAADRYVAVDRLDDDVATLVVAPWPVVDPETGRLAFLPETDHDGAVVGVDVLRERIDRARAGSGQLERPVRVGDVFWVARYRANPADWGQVIDVTRAGRFVAKAAFLATASGAPLADDMGAFGIDDAEPLDAAPPPPAPATGEPAAAPPPGPVAFPAV